MLAFFGRLALFLFGVRIYLREEGDLRLAVELVDAFAVLLLAAHGEIGEAVDDDSLVGLVEAILEENLDPSGDAGIDGAGGVGLGDDGFRDHGDLSALGGAEEVEFGGIKGIAEFGKDILGEGDVCANRGGHHFEEFAAFH